VKWRQKLARALQNGLSGKPLVESVMHLVIRQQWPGSLACWAVRVINHSCAAEYVCPAATIASNRLAMLAQAISSTNTTAHMQYYEPVLEIRGNERVKHAQKVNAPVPHLRILLAHAVRDAVHLGLGLFDWKCPF
jgi:hypothetical protein